MKVSIVIPTYEAHGRGVEFTRRAIDSIVMQHTSHRIEVIVSDHSQNDDIYTLVKDDDFIKYIRNEENRGNSSANLNRGIKEATGDIIKPLFMDDFFFDPDALHVILGHFSQGSKWVVCGNNSLTDERGYFNDFIPYWNDDIIFGKNTLSSPSCVAYVNRKYMDSAIMWDERLIWLMDCKFYQDLYDVYGEPTIEPKILVTNYGHSKQLTHTMGDERKRWEEELIRNEYTERWI